MRTESAFPLKRLKHLVSLRRVQVDGRNDDRPYVGLQDITSWTGCLAQDCVGNRQVEATAQGNTFEPGDVLFGKLRPYLAKVWLAEFSGRASTELLVMQPNRVEPRFLAYVCLARDFVEKVDASTYGSKMPRAEWDLIGNMSIPVPERIEQRMIADYLDRETVRLDALVAEEERVLALLKERREAKIVQVLTRGIETNASHCHSALSWPYKIPAHWKLVPLRFLVDMIGGATPDTGRIEYWDGDTPWVSPKDMKQDEISDSEAHVSALALSETALQVVPKNAVLVVVRGMILAHSFPVAIANCPVTINQDMKALICRDALNPAFLRDFLQASKIYLVSKIDTAAHGTKRMETAVLGSLQVAVPPLHEQQEICDEIAAEICRLDVIQTAAARAINILKERRAAVITSAVTGQINVASAA